MKMLKFKKLHPKAHISSPARPGDAGYDLHSLVDFTLLKAHKAIISTGIAVEIPSGFVGLVCPRSGLAARYGITIVNAPGIIDAGYRGELKVILANLGAEPFVITRGDRIAQLVITQCFTPTLEEVEELSDTVRGLDGFGSTGIKVKTDKAYTVLGDK